MNKSVGLHIVVIIFAIIAGTFLAQYLSGRQADIIGPRVKMMRTAAPLGGFNKFASDVQWMLFINYCGGLDSVNEKNVGEITRRLESILANDPNFEQAYSMGGLMLSVRAPKKSAEILMRGANNRNLQHNWQLPFMAGHVLYHFAKDEDYPNGDRLDQAENMFRLALSRNRSASSMPYLASALLRTKAKQIAKKGTWGADQTPVVNNKQAYLCALYDEWKKCGGGTRSCDDTYSGGGGSSVGMDTIKPRLLKAVKDSKASVTNVKGVSAKDKKNVMKTVNKVMKDVLESEHLCPKCLTAYGPGDNYCSECGAKVKVYGVCPKCKAVVKGKYCDKCGTKNPAYK